MEEFCARCGELQPAHRDLSVRAVAGETVQEFVGVDGKVPRTVWALIRTPGLLTREFITGRRGHYTKPLSLFLVLNLVFFVIQPYTGLLRYNLANYIGTEDDRSDTRAAMMVRGKLARTGESWKAYETRFNATLSAQKKSMLLFSVPISALAMLAVFARKRRYYVEHLVFSIHGYAFLLVLLTVGVTSLFTAASGLLMLAALAGLPTAALYRVVGGEPALVFVIFASTAGYLILAVRRAYDMSWKSAIPRGLVIAFVQMLLIRAFHDVLFFTAFYAT